MTTSTLTLTEFLLARIEDDEAVARTATDGPWWHDPTKWNSVDHEESVFAGSRGVDAITVASTGPGDDLQSMADAQHVARHDPARVLADAASKRTILEMHQPSDVDRNCGFQCRNGICPTLSALASIYADHPEFREEWH